MDETNNYNEKTILNSYQLPTRYIVRTKAKSLRSDPRKISTVRELLLSLFIDSDGEEEEEEEEYTAENSRR